MKIVSRYILILAFFLPLLAFGQTEVMVRAELDSARIFIGGQIDLTLVVSQPKTVKVQFPQFKDTIVKSIEVVEIGKIDTVGTDNGRINLIQKIRITSFDSGLHYIPPVRFEVLGKIANSFATTNENGLTVVNPFENVDPKKGVFDIKTVIVTPWTIGEILPYLIWFAIGWFVIASIIVLFYYLKERRSPLVEMLLKDKPKEPPYVIALRELERIHEEKSWQRGEAKRFYSDLTDVVRTYIEEQYNIPALESTTDELLLLLKKGRYTDEKSVALLSEVVQQADLVKFAKYIPTADECEKHLAKSKLFVEQTLPSEPIVSEVKEDVAGDLKKIE